MTCGQGAAILPNLKLGVVYNCRNGCNAISRLSCGSLKFHPVCLENRNLKSRRLDYVCMAKGNAGKDTEGFSWESLKNAMGGIGKEENVQDWVKKQMRENELGDDGGDGGRPGGSGSGSGGFGGGGFGGEDDEGFAGIFDETVQVILATVAFIFVYIYLISGAEITKLARDYIKYLFGASPSMRLMMVMDEWRSFLDKITRTVDTREDWLERAIVLTPTWWHNPKKLASRMRSKNDY